jgi:hypothetical protein
MKMFFVEIILARNVADVQRAIEKIFPLVYEFKKPRNPAEKDVQEEKELLMIQIPTTSFSLILMRILKLNLLAKNRE